MAASGRSVPEFDRERQIRYFAYCLRKLPDAYSKLDTSRLILVHFAVHALDLLGVWDDEEIQCKMGLDKRKITEWVYSLQISSQNNNHYESHVGFIGGSFLGGSFCDSDDQPWEYNYGHLAMTYTALCTLRALGDDFSEVDKEGIVRALKYLQLDDGSFKCIFAGSEHDMRFLYCACSISHMLNDWRGLDKAKAVKYIQSCRSFDGAIALLPGQEGHGGSTYTAVASLVLMNKVDEVIDAEWKKDLIRWCVHRQVGGMQGRPNKAEDTCYSYWIGSTLRLLGEDSLLDHNVLRAYVKTCQTQYGGFGKVLGAYPDLLHSYYSLAYLSLSQDFGENEQLERMKPLNATLGICHERVSCFEPWFP